MLEFRTHGKWILVGEHTVIRGGTALVFPVEDRYLDFQFEPGGNDLMLTIDHPNNDLEMAFWGVLEKALQKLGLRRSQISGKLHLFSNIPVGAGMGASATLCVSLVRWLTALGHLEESSQFEFARELEDLFHGQSSGLDVAVALENKPLEYKKNGFKKIFEPTWTPHFCLSYCGRRGVTSDCISRVQNFMEQNPDLGRQIDETMQESVQLALSALKQDGNLMDLQKSINMACDCFQSWGLISEPLRQHMAELKQQGAIACKPTGSGDGGFVLSLWESPVDLPQLIKA